VKARSVLKLILAMPIYVRPVEVNGKRLWKFAGLARYDRVLAGGVRSDGYSVTFYPESTDPDQLFYWFAQADGIIPERRLPAGSEDIFVAPDGEVHTFWGRQLPPISGGSGGVDDGSGPSGPPIPIIPPIKTENTAGPWATRSQART